MDTLELIEARLRHTLGLINGQRDLDFKDEVRLDIDLGSDDRTYCRFRTKMLFDPLLTLEVSKQQDVYYFDVSGVGSKSDVYEATKKPPRYNPSDVFWLADELDTPMDAIETHMKKVLS